MIQIINSMPSPNPTGVRLTRRARTIQNALPIVAKAIGRNLNVRVIIGGDRAFRQGDTITLPTLPFEDPEVEIPAFGYLIHESGHVRYTEQVEPESPAHHRLWNILEDVRIERMLGQEYPGFAVTLRKLAAKLVNDGDFKAPSEEDLPAIKLSQYLLYRLRAEVLGQSELKEYATVAETQFRSAFPAGAAVRIGAAIGAVRGLKSSQEALNLARQVLDIIKEEAEPPPPPDSPDEDPATEPTEGSPDPTPTDSQAAQRENLREVLNAKESDFGQEIGEVISQALENSAGQAVESGGDSAGVGRAELPLDIPDIDPASVLSEVTSATIALRTRIRSLVESVRYGRHRHARHGRRIDRRRLTRVLCGDLKIFKRMSPAVDINTAVVLLLDRSGSMENDSRIEIGVQSTLAAAAALESIRGVKVSAGAFPGHATDVELLTHFSESVKRTANRYKGITADGGTPLLPAIFWAVDELMMRPEPRKILLVATDGMPNEPDSCREAIARCWTGGIETYGIGIRVPNIGQLFQRSCAITSVEDLAGAMFGLLQEALTRRIAA